MIRLTATTEKLQAVLAVAVAATQPQAIVCYSDQTATGYSGGKQVTALNSTTDVDILAAPAASTIRDVDYLSIFNRDSASITVTVKYDISATDSIIITVTLLTLETLQFVHGAGWSCLDATGKIKVLTTGGTVTSVAFTAAPSSLFDVSGSPITTAGTIALSMDNQNANLVLAGPASGAAAPPSARALVVDDGLSYAADGRLTLSSATPVMTSDVSGSTSIFYAFYRGNKIALYDGTSWVNTTFTELTNTTTDNTKNPAAVANNSNYDLFVWSDAGTIRLGRGPAWTSDTGRGTGAGTTELERVSGIWVNKIAITNGPAAQRGRYVGSVRSNGSAQIDWKLGGDAAGGSAGLLYVWNMYNRIDVHSMVRDSTASWTTTSTTFVSLNASTGNRISFLSGLNEDSVSSQHRVFSTNSVAGQSASGIGLDSTTTLAGSGGFGVSGGSANNLQAGTYSGRPGLGLHFFQAIQSVQSGTGTWYGDFFAGHEDRQALTAQLRM